MWIFIYRKETYKYIFIPTIYRTHNGTLNTPKRIEFMKEVNYIKEIFCIKPQRKKNTSTSKIKLSFLKTLRK